MEPLVSVIIPAYNQADLVIEAIESVLAQRYPRDRMEVIVVDDGSTDGTGRVVKAFGEGIRYHYQENAGKAAATSAALELVNGVYTLNLDPDDMFLPDKIGKVVRVFEDHPEVVHVGHSVIYWDPVKGTRREEHMPEQLLGQVLGGQACLKAYLADNCFYGGGSSFAARSDSLKGIPFYEGIGFNVDAYMVFSLMNAGDSFYLKEPLSFYRLHPGSYSGRLPRDRAVMDMEAARSIYDGMLAQGVPDDLAALLEFRWNLAELRLKGLEGEKRLVDIAGLWKKVMDTAGTADIDPIRLIKGYDVIKRSFPQRLVDLVRSLRTERGGR
jgi:glycosyltransferase involved in cell wall biosynthesis